MATKDQRIVRSYLFVPASRPDRIPKAQQAGADAVIVDFEDAVGGGEKDSARVALTAQLSADQPVYLRINGADTPWFEKDLEICKHPGVCGVLLPKAEEATAVQRVAAAIGRDKALIPIIENAPGFDQARTLAAQAGVQRLAFGTIDFQVDLQITGEAEELHYFRSQLVLVSRLAGLQPPVDGVTVAINDADVLRTETQRGRRFGFGAKLCIHPKQVPVVNSCYRPTEEEIAWAKRVLQAAEQSKGGAVAVDGKMVDVPVIQKAQQILADSR